MSHLPRRPVQTRPHTALLHYVVVQKSAAHPKPFNQVIAPSTELLFRNHCPYHCVPPSLYISLRLSLLSLYLSLSLASPLAMAKTMVLG